MARGADCDRCPLRARPFADTQFPTAKRADGRVIALCSRSPGPHDTYNGQPFSGPSGEVVNYLAEQHGGKRQEMILTNVVLCRADKPSKEAIACCRPRLEHDLNDATDIICGGAEAVREVMGGTVQQNRGRRIPNRYGGASHTAIASFNPAFALREQDKFPSISDDFRRAHNPAPPFREPDYGYTEDLDEAKGWLDTLHMYDRLACDTETTGLIVGSTLVCIGFGTSNTNAIVLGQRVCRTTEGLALLKQFFEEYTGRTIWHNGKFDVRILRSQDIPAVVHEDTLLLSYACDERPGVHSLDYLLQNELEWPYYTPPAVEAGKKNGFQYDDLGLPFTQFDELYKYNAFDCAGSYQLFQLLRERAVEDNVLGRYTNVLIPAANAYAEVEARGIPFDAKRAQQITEMEVKPRLREFSAEASFIVGKRINLNSHVQVAKYLYDVMEIPDPRLNRERERSCDEKHRDWIRDNVSNPEVLAFVDTLHKFKKLDKLRSTYLDGLIPKINPHTGRIHCDFLLHGTETDRTSSRGPNLQNQPRTRDEDIANGEGYVNIRQLYYAPAGYVIVQSDYSQCELRTAAMLSGDEFLLTCYHEKRDLHSEVARELYGPHFTYEQRQIAKNVNFSALYGVGPYTLYLMYKVPLDEAPGLIRKWWKRFPKLAEWVKVVHSQVEDDGFIQTPFGHKRRFHLLTDTNYDHALKEGVNTYVQGTASDFTTMSVVALEPVLPELDAGVVLSVHDSVVAICRQGHTREVANTIKEVMETRPAELLGWDEIPFSADIATGYDWGHVEKGYEHVLG
jgi:DNA polymerase-1